MWVIEIDTLRKLATRVNRFCQLSFNFKVDLNWVTNLTVVGRLLDWGKYLSDINRSNSYTIHSIQESTELWFFENISNWITYYCLSNGNLGFFVANIISIRVITSENDES